MFKNSNRDNNTKVRHMCSGITFTEVYLVNLFEKNHEPTQEEGFYSGEEEYLLSEEHSESSRAEERKTEEPCREVSETLGTVHIVEVSTITPPIVSVTLRNQSNQSYQSLQSTVTSSTVHTQSRNLGRYMADEMRLPTFRGYGSEDLDQQWFLCDALWSIKNATDKDVK
jgi:hypothetical protein